MSKSSAFNYKGVGQKYKVVIRTTGSAHSAIIAGALVGGMALRMGSIAVDELWASIKAAHKRRHDRSKYLSSMFGETRNADFIIGAVFPNSEDGIPWADCDIKAAAKMVAGLRGIFSEIADIEDIDIDEVDNQTLKDDEQIDPNRNHVFFCIKNPLVQWIMGHTEEAPVGKLREDRRWKDLPYMDIREGAEWCFVGEGNIYRPIFNSSITNPRSKDPGMYDLDYLMILKIPTIFQRGREGVDFVIAGAHGCGTEGIGLVLEDDGILGQIKEKIGPSQFFQAIIKVNAGTRPHSRHTSIREMITGFMKREKDHRNQFYEEPIFEPISVEFIDAVSLDTYRKTKIGKETDDIR